MASSRTGIYRAEGGVRDTSAVTEMGRRKGQAKQERGQAGKRKVAMCL